MVNTTTFSTATSVISFKLIPKTKPNSNPNPYPSSNSNPNPNPNYNPNPIYNPFIAVLNGYPWK